MTDRILNPQVAGLLDLIGDRVAQEASDDFKFGWMYLEIDPDDMSPIEQMLSIGIFYALTSNKHFGRVGEGGFSNSKIDGISPQKFEGFRIRPQMPIGKYRADFFVTYRHYTGVAIGAVIECDGHDFHEKTKEQAQSDKERDRYFQSLGLMVLRYTGSEIFRDPVGRALDALNIIFDRADSAVRDDNV